MRKSTLDRDRLLDAALAVIDRGGLRTLTIRALATELSIPPMSLYTHFESKEELLDRAFDRLLHRLFDTRHGATWQAEIDAVCRHARATLLEHPQWIPLATRVSVPRWTLGFYDHLLGLTEKDGLAPETAMLGFSSALMFTLGSVLVEQMMERAHPVPLRQLALVKSMVAVYPRPVYPRAAKSSAKFDRWSFDAAFDLGLRSLIRGIEQEVGRPKVRRRGASTAPVG